MVSKDITNLRPDTAILTSQATHFQIVKAAKVVDDIPPELKRGLEERFITRTVVDRKF
jgi:hypothetical protein